MTGTPRIAIDNDIVLKASSYGLASNFWPAGGPDIGVLAAARFAVPTYVDRGRGRDKARAKTQLAAFLARASFLEPTEPEIRMALSFEVAAQGARLALDTGESQLCAMVISRSMDSLETGDKRAIELVIEIHCSRGSRQMNGRTCLPDHLAPTLVSMSEISVCASLMAWPSMSLLKYTNTSRPARCHSITRSAHGCSARRL